MWLIKKTPEMEAMPARRDDTRRGEDDEGDEGDEGGESDEGGEDGEDGESTRPRRKGRRCDHTAMGWFVVRYLCLQQPCRVNNVCVSTDYHSTRWCSGMMACLWHYGN